MPILTFSGDNMNNSDKYFYGTNYELAGRYGYSAIDGSHKNGSGSSALITGVKPTRLAKEILHCVNRTQEESLTDLLGSMLAGESANSEELSLYALNDGELHEQHQKRLIETMAGWFAEYGTDFSKWDRYSISLMIQYCVEFFKHAAEKYSKEFPRGNGNDWYNFTQLDFTICAHDYIKHSLAEYKINGLV